jgi:hypothetical protein
MSRKRKERAAARRAAKEQVRAPDRPADFSPEPEYWGALGQFIEAFALAETALFVYFITWINIDLPMGKALFASSKCDQLFGLIHKAWHVRSLPEDEREPLDDLLLQFKAIKTVRNHVVHNRSRVSPDRGRITSNVARTYRDDQIIEQRVSPTLLYELSSDLGRITYHLMVLAMYAKVPSTDPDRVRQLRVPELGAPWQYNRR